MVKRSMLNHLCACMHTHIYAYIHANAHTYLHTYMHARVHAYIHACVHIQAVVYSQTFIFAFIQSCHACMTKCTEEVKMVFYNSVYSCSTTISLTIGDGLQCKFNKTKRRHQTKQFRTIVIE